ncbi:hypothetical protein [Candidatus Phytoplasma australiense]|uniref:Uncharacterized protein n=1 Tax=Strawberry lethal yellows phytoplasma (CPA) str. NZSb11 TaxID=980422 RepID=R4S1J6_PHYAS|nr:hypothetical protein [Candidatus Phytoplasma australiense]AGL90679.1 hypothetical protein SLY_0764 [Strawberry lethal yellows phytoplasma (CPA) str. NZSb11]
MELFKVLVIIGFLGVFFGLGPLLIWFVQKRENKNRIKKVNLKTLMIWYYVITIIAIGGIGLFAFLDNKYDIKNSKPKTYTISEPKVEIEAEWFETESKYEWKGYESINIGNKKYPIEENNKPYRNDKGKWVMDGVADEGEWKIKVKYIFYGLNGFGRGQHCEYEPNDIMSFMKNPFDKWKTKHSTNDYFDTFITRDKYDDSQFDNMFINDYVDHYTELNYKGPKWLIEEDKDFFMDEVQCHIINPKDSRYPKDEKKNYYLHFNPKQRYITLYTKKFNTQPTEESTKPRLRG